MYQPALTIDRRTLLAFLLGGGMLVAGGGPIAACSATENSTPDEPASTELDPELAVASIAVVGERYLELVPEEADVKVLAELLVPLDGEIPRDPTSDLLVLADMVRADFDAGNVISIDGWLLSRTEGRAAALFAIDE